MWTDLPSENVRDHMAPLADKVEAASVPIERHHSAMAHKTTVITTVLARSSYGMGNYRRVGPHSRDHPFWKRRPPHLNGKQDNQPGEAVGKYNPQQWLSFQNRKKLIRFAVRASTGYVPPDSPLNRIRTVIDGLPGPYIFRSLRIYRSSLI
jgi:hypothetical protein